VRRCRGGEYERNNSDAAHGQEAMDHNKTLNCEKLSGTSFGGESRVSRRFCQ
jgi:hypothetical protein